MSVKVPTEKNFRRAKAVKPVRKKGGGRSVPWRAATIAVAGVLGVYSTYRAFDLVVHASTLQVRKISVHGNVRLSSGEVRTLIDGLRGTSILTADLAHYRARLMESPWVAGSGAATDPSVHGRGLRVGAPPACAVPAWFRAVSR